MAGIHDLLAKIEERRKSKRQFAVLAFFCSLFIFVSVLLLMSIPSLALGA